MHPFSSIDTAIAWKKSHFILLERSAFDTIDNLLIAVHTFSMRMLPSFSVDEILLLRYVNWSSNFRGLPLKVKMALSWLNHMNFLKIWVYIEANAFCYLLQAMLLGLSLGRYICEKCWIICVVCICCCFCWYSSLSYLLFKKCDTVFFYLIY